MENGSREAPFRFPKHFTTVKHLHQILDGRCLYMGDTSKWEDANDTALMERFRALKGAPYALAICFDCNTETVHHWNAFGGAQTCCVSFDGGGLLDALNRAEGVLHGKMEYVKVGDLRSLPAPVSIDQLPFFKRYPYFIEEEYRAVSTGRADHRKIPISLDIITTISLSQKMPEAEYQALKKTIRAQCSARVNRNTISKNAQWVTFFTRADCV